MAEPTSTSAQSATTTVAPPAIAAHNEAERALDQSQRAASTLQATVNESMTTTSHAPTAAESSPAATDIKAVDQNLANQLDSLLEGDFETIDAVLHGTTAALTPSTTTPAEVPVSAQTPPIVNAGAPASVAEANPSGHSATMPAVASVKSAEPAIASAASNSASSVEVVGTTQTFRSPSRPTSSGATRDAASGDRFGAIRQSIINVLMLINLPLRFVPRGLKPAIDWIALSLVAWVPIVWVLVFVIGPGGGTAYATASAGQAEVLHSESTINAKSIRGAGGHDSPGDAHASGGAKAAKKPADHDAGKSASKSKAKPKSPPTKAAGNKLPRDKNAPTKGKSKAAQPSAGAHH